MKQHMLGLSSLFTVFLFLRDVSTNALITDHQHDVRMALLDGSPLSRNVRLSGFLLLHGRCTGLSTAQHASVFKDVIVYANTVLCVSNHHERRAIGLCVISVEWPDVT